MGDHRLEVAVGAGALAVTLVTASPWLIFGLGAMAIAGVTTVAVVAIAKQSKK